MEHDYNPVWERVMGEVEVEWAQHLLISPFGFKLLGIDGANLEIHPREEQRRMPMTSVITTIVVLTVFAVLPNGVMKPLGEFTARTII